MKKADVLVSFAEDLAVLLNAGSDLDSALGLVINSHAESPLKRVLSELRADVRKGIRLSSALSAHVDYFDAYFIGMVRSGEASGKLSLALEQLAAQLERQQELRNQINTALIYPTILAVAMALSMVLLIGVIVPKLSALFESFGGELSFAAQCLLSLGQFLNAWGRFILVSLAISIVFAFAFKEALQINHRVSLGLRRVPVIGALLRQIELARFTSTLSSLLASGLTQIEAISVAAESFQGVHSHQQIQRAILMIKDGQSLSAAMGSVDGLGELYSHSVASGEQAGQLPATLAVLAQRLEKDFSRRAQRLASMVEPILIIVLGVVIGMIILTVFSALQTMGDLPVPL
ncbi:MAG: general secretion pathway protein F [Arenicella sp.]|jgi:general secretion pathway protein F